MTRSLLLGFVLLSFSLGFFKMSEYHAALGFSIPDNKSSNISEVFFKANFASSRQHTQTHAASEIELKDGRIRAFWFSGSREGAADVEIHSAVFDPAHGFWGKEQSVATREETGQSLMRFISKLGNPVVARSNDGKLWLYFVTVSMGGWAGSSITAMTSDDDGETWSPARRLITSPFLNISTLIKGAPFLYSDGTVGLPVYHEFINKFCEILHFDKTGKLIDEQRLSAGKDHGLQPIILPQSEKKALVLMRHTGDEHRKLIGVSTEDGGKNWTVPVKLGVLNPDAAVSAVILPDGHILAVLNNAEQGRDALSLMVSSDNGTSWENIVQLEDQHNQITDEIHYLKTVKELAGNVTSSDVDEHVRSSESSMCIDNHCRFEFSYPYLIQVKGGDFHLVYTWNRSFIKHIWFSQSWLNLQLNGHGKSAALNSETGDARFPLPSLPTVSEKLLAGHPEEGGRISLREFHVKSLPHG